jgi:TolB protein
MNGCAPGGPCRAHTRGKLLRFIALAMIMGLVPLKSAFAQSSGGSDESIHVVVGPGAQQRQAMAVPEPLCTDAPLRVCNQVAEVLRHDMTLSFFFSVVAPRSYLADPMEPIDEPVWGDWSNVGARYLLKSHVAGPAPYRLAFRLYDVVGERVIPVARQAASGLGEKDIRRAVHRFANDVLGAITGTPGVFDTRIAFSQRVAPGVKAIAAVDMDGAGRGLVISNGSINMLPSWGFGGVLYTSFVDGKPEIYFGKRKFSQDGGHYRRVAVSRDGARVVASISYGGQSDLYLLGKNGKVIRNLTNTPVDEVSPTFSPDGSKIAFVSSAAGSPQIYVMSSSGGGMRRLTHAGGYNYAPDWGPNGLIVFAGMEGNRSDIFTVTEDGVIERLTQNQGSNKDPSWSPDGRYVAFVSRRKGASGVWLMSADGRYQVSISSGGGVGNVAWQR